MNDRNQDKKPFNWGGLCKGLLAGAAVIAGIALVCPGAIDSVAKGMSPILTHVKALFGDEVSKNLVNAWSARAGQQALQSSAEQPGLISSGIGWMMTKAAGIVALVVGTKYILSDKGEANEDRAAYHRASRESFMINEDIRRTKAVLDMRMQAAGHQPAAAIPGR